MSRALGLSIVACFLISGVVHSQDASTGAIRGTVSDPLGARLPAAAVQVTNLATGVHHDVVTDEQGVFVVQLLPPGDYSVRAEAKDLAPHVTSVHVEVGGEIQLAFQLKIAAARETLEVSEPTQQVETQTSAVSAVLEEKEITGLPLNGRRFSDLIALTPGMSQDPRGLTSSSQGDLAFGGVRGFQNSFLVDGGDNNNAFFGQARGRYRAPYQFSNEVIQEFRVSSNSYNAELGRAGGAVVNVVTKSGSNHLHGSAFYYLRDSSFNAQQPFMDFKPTDRQQQFGFTVGGPVVKNRVFFFGGFDQHIFHVPNVVRFLNGQGYVEPGPGDYESTDQNVVFAAAQRLSQQAGNFPAKMIGNAGFFKLDVSLTPRHYLAARINTSRYHGTNNVFLDPASPLSCYGISDNGEEQVSTETGALSLTSGLTTRMTSHLRLQFSRDLQQSTANSSDPLIRIKDIIDGIGRSSILPRRTREHRLHLADTLSLEGRRHSIKFGGDAVLTWIYNYFPTMEGGEYLFNAMRVDQWTFQPHPYGMHISPLRAYAHDVPRYYVQDFGNPVSHPDSNEYAAFVQDSIRVTSHFALNLGVRYDLQTFRDGLVSNPLWPASGHVPFNDHNFAPRAGFAYSVGEKRPLVIRGAYGIFYTRIPSIYTSAIETDNGLNRTHLFLDNMNYFDHPVFPQYPNPLVYCAPGAMTCTPPAGLEAHMQTDVSSFAPNFQTPYVQQANFSLEREVAENLGVEANYLYVRGTHLIRARDINLPPPVQLFYPVYDPSGLNFTGQYYEVASFASWSMTCLWPPCINDLSRPNALLGAINQFESAASSTYQGLTLSVRRRMASGVYFRVGYTYAHSIDNLQDALVAGGPVAVQNSYQPSERGSSVTDQRHRFVFSGMWEPMPFHHDHPWLGALFNDWRLSGVTTAGSGRPVDARVVGDPNRDGNGLNDRLPGLSRNSLVGPDYASTDIRLSRRFYAGDRIKLEFSAEAFNLMNRQNKQVVVTDTSFQNLAATFVPLTTPKIGLTSYPGYYQKVTNFLHPVTAYAPRQIQFSLRVGF